MSNEVHSTVIATTEDTSDPVVRVFKGDSKADIIVDTEAECLNIWYVYSDEKGDMELMLDHIVQKLGYDWLQFISPMDAKQKEVAEKLKNEFANGPIPTRSQDREGRNIREVLDGFQEVVEEHNGQEIPMLVGFWEIES